MNRRSFLKRMAGAGLLALATSLPMTGFVERWTVRAGHTYGAWWKANEDFLSENIQAAHAAAESFLEKIGVPGTYQVIVKRPDPHNPNPLQFYSTVGWKVTT